MQGTLARRAHWLSIAATSQVVKLLLDKRR